jgi:hypothetical protein
MRVLTATLLAVPLLLAGGDRHCLAQSNRGAAARPITLTQSEYSHLGARTELARPATYGPTVHGYGIVLNAATVAQLDADIASASAAVLQSRASLERTRRLYHTANAASLESLDAAEHEATANNVQLSLADRKEAAMFGADAPWRGPTRNTDILTKLASGAEVIVQATFPLDVRFAAGPISFTLTHLGQEQAHTVASTTIVWRAPSDSTIPGQSFYAIADGRDLEQGEHVLVYAPTGPAIIGVRIPSEAVVITAQQAWCYVVDAPLTFRRVALELSHPFEGGYFIVSGVKPRQPVLVKGTGLLLARELGSSGYGPD